MYNKIMKNKDLRKVLACLKKLMNLSKIMLNFVFD